MKKLLKLLLFTALGAFLIALGLGAVADFDLESVISFTIFLSFTIIGMSILVCLPDSDVCSGYINRHKCKGDEDES